MSGRRRKTMLHYPVYRRRLDPLGVLMVLAAHATLAASRFWLGVRATYLWLRFRQDSKEDEWMTYEDAYCERYWEDPQISDLIDEYLDYLRDGLDAVRVGAPAEEALSSDFDDICRRLEDTIAERFWQEFPKLRRDKPADQERVREMARERGGQLYERMFWPLAF
jgi:hypothetical protein